MSPIALYRRTWRLNILWMVAFNGILLQNVSDGPSNVDRLRGFVPCMTILIWIIVQRNGLERRDYIVTLFTDVTKQLLSRLKGTLPQGLRKGEPFYRLYVFLEMMLFLELAAGLLEVLWPWLTGRDASLLRPAISLVVFATTVLSWGYVKAANRAAARALQAAIDPAGH